MWPRTWPRIRNAGRTVLHDIGTFELKTRCPVSVSNLYSDEVGNANLPTKLHSRQETSRPCALGGRLALHSLCWAQLLPRLIFARGPTTSALPCARQKHRRPPRLKNRSEDKANAYFTDGVQDEILTTWQRLLISKLSSRTSVLQY